ncbi:MAG: ABC transporter substrate-binding protein [Legionellales bacterium]|jgi:phospholipid transport system substrate-binding protein
MLKKISSVLIGLLFSFCVWAAQSPDQITRMVTDDLFAQLKADQAAIKTDSSRLVAIVNSTIMPHTDLQETSKRVLAKHWRDLTPAQQQEFQTEFEKLLIRTYAVSFRSYDKQVVDIVETRENPNNPNMVEVRTVIKEPGKPNLPVNYRFLKEADGTWKVYDINVENVSLVSSFRNQIGDAISRDGFDGMMANMRAKNQEKF